MYGSNVKEVMEKAANDDGYSFMQVVGQYSVVRNGPASQSKTRPRRG